MGLLQGRLLVVNLRVLLLIIRVAGLLARGRRQGVGVILRRHGDFAGADRSFVSTLIADGNLGRAGARRGRWMGLAGFRSGSN